MPIDAGFVPERQKVGVFRETTWGSGATSSVLLPVTGLSWTEVQGHEMDEAVRNILGRDFDAFQTTQRVEASLEGPFYLDELGYLLAAFFGDDAVTTFQAGSYRQHQFAATSLPGSLVVRVGDPLDEIELLGCLVTSFTLRFSAAEGLVTWSADLLGRDFGQPASPTTIAADATGAPLRGFQGSFQVAAEASPPARLIDFELTATREIELVFLGDNIQIANERTIRTPQATARATIEFSTYNDFLKHSDFENKKEQWKIRLATNGIKVTDTDATANTALGSATSSKGFIDIIIPKADYGEGAVSIARFANPLTLEWNVRALFLSTQASGREVLDIRLINDQTAAYDVGT